MSEVSAAMGLVNLRHIPVRLDQMVAEFIMQFSSLYI
jgi:hypothetical protein